MTDKDGKRGGDARELEVAKPCTKTWDSLVGDGRRRYCSECELHVHNSAALTRAEVRELLDDARERVCMRVVRDVHGAPVYLESGACGGGQGPIRPLPRAAGWLLAAGAALLTACPESAPTPDGNAGGGQTPSIDPDPGSVMGVVAPLPELMGEVSLPVDCDQEPVPGCDESGEEAPSCDPLPQGTTPSEALGRVALPPTRDETPG